MHSADPARALELRLAEFAVRFTLPYGEPLTSMEHAREVHPIIQASRGVFSAGAGPTKGEGKHGAWIAAEVIVIVHPTVDNRDAIADLYAALVAGQSVLSDRRSRLKIEDWKGRRSHLDGVVEIWKHEPGVGDPDASSLSASAMVASARHLLALGYDVER